MFVQATANTRLPNWTEYEMMQLNRILIEHCRCSLLRQTKGLKRSGDDRTLIMLILQRESLHEDWIQPFIGF